MINIKNYWSDLDDRIELLLKDGGVKLPTLKNFDLDSIAEEISLEMGSSTFKELSLAHKKFLDLIKINKYLSPKLFEVAKKVFKYKGNLDSQYNIARRVFPGNTSEQYRVHFDSHLFTVVLPIKIPVSPSNKSIGELVYFLKARSMPKNEIINIIDKIYYKKFASKKGLEKLSVLHTKKIENFKNYEPLLFLGKTTLHSNYSVSSDCSSYRLTLLAHFFDDSPKYGIGNLLRLIRKR